MVLCFVAGLGINKNEIDLCIMPDKPDILSVPVRIKDMKETFAAFQRIGPDEGVTVTIDPQDYGIIVAAMTPASIFLTPNLPQSPGYRARKVKIFIEPGPNGNTYRTLYEREGKDWEEWVANRERQ